ncbi:MULTISPECIES: YoaK family protein [Bradyrhizobium]|uniref:YoaK family protein n=1 Tax=Bradyrhizobium TaxID=374 RepID=UPI00054CEAEB|nr:MULTISPECIES: YoaK family protein [unclassified Bradyrhizobium]MDA9422235.1 membrane protein [Bradyrhizobium sp. CCBAU 53380]MDA9467785.1 membrane protein [Bradyrhizobium sp. CCBAU 53415]
MSSLGIAAAPLLRRDETIAVALLLAFAGGCLDAYTWIVHGVMANAQTANLVLLWVYGMAGERARAMQFVPPIMAFALGIVVAAWLRRAAGERASAISTLIEILVLIAVGILHNRMPEIAGTLGISFVAAMQAAVFTRVEGATYSTVMITGNMRQAIEGIFAVASGGAAVGTLRRSGIFTAVCGAFGLGAALGALMTKAAPDLALGLPVVALLIVLLRCEVVRSEASP